MSEAQEEFSPELFRRAQALFDDLVQRPGTERRRAAASIEDTQLRRAVGALLDADEEATLLSGDGGPGVVRTFFGTDVPDRIGSFEVVRKLGDGGMGVVYEAVQQRPKRRVALKALLAQRETPEAVERFLQEIQTMVDVVHPGIPQVYEVFEVEGLPVVAMELIDGRSVATFCRPLEQADKLQVIERIVEIAAFAHERGIVHRDLKPSNILVTGAGEPKILDFGIAAAMGSMDRAAGTVTYSAPEQLLGGVVDARADVYSLGVVAWELLCGRRPPIDPELVGLPAPEMPAADASTLGKPLAAILQRAIALDPAQRYADARDLGDDLRRLGSHRPVQALEGDRAHWLASHARRLAPVVVPTTAAAAAIAAFALWKRPVPAAPVCSASAVTEVWSPEVRSRVGDRLERGGSVISEDAPRILDGLDRYAGELEASSVENCERGDGRWAEARNRCLDRRLLALAEVVRRLDGPDAAQGDADELLTNVERLPRISRCAEPAYLAAGEPQPDDPSLEAPVAKLRRELVRTRAELYVGAPEEARSRAAQHVQDAKALGFRPLLAEAKILLGEALLEVDEPAAASDTHRDAFLDAQASDHVAAARRAGVRRIQVLIRMKDTDEITALTDEWIDLLTALHEQGADPLEWAELHCALVSHELRQADFEGALEHAQTCIDIRKRELGESHLDVARALRTRAVTHYLAGDDEQGIAVVNEALEIARPLVPPAHPIIAENTGLLADLEMNVGRPSVALERMQGLTEPLEARYGSDSVQVAEHVFTLGQLLALAGREDSAMESYERARDVHRRVYGPDSAGELLARQSIGGLLCRQKKVEEGMAELESVVPILEADPELSIGPLSSAYRELADCARGAGDIEGVERWSLESIALTEAKRGEGHPHIVPRLTALGHSLVEADKPERALPHLERALAIIDKEALSETRRGTVMDAIAYAHARAGAFDEAKNMLERAPTAEERAGASTADLINHHFISMDVWERVGDSARALEEARAARALIPDEAKGADTQVGVFAKQLDEWIAEHEP